MECVHYAMNLRTILKGWQHKKLFVSDLLKKISGITVSLCNLMALNIKFVLNQIQIVF